jgi:hypothetical protein
MSSPAPRMTTGSVPLRAVRANTAVLMTHSRQSRWSVMADVLAYDADANRIYVAAESGWVSILDHTHGHLIMQGSAHLADGAHTLALDPASHHTYLPIPTGDHGSPQLWEYAQTK